GKTQRTDSIRSHSPLMGVMAQLTERPLSILQWERMRIVARALGHSILQQTGCHPNRIEPFANFGSFEIDRYNIVSATWANYYGGSRVLLRRRPINAQSRLGNISDTRDTFAGNDPAVCFRRVMLLANRSFFTLCGPQFNYLEWLSTDAATRRHSVHRDR